MPLIITHSATGVTRDITTILIGGFSKEVLLAVILDQSVITQVKNRLKTALTLNDECRETKAFTMANHNKLKLTKQLTNDNSK